MFKINVFTALILTIPGYVYADCINLNGAVANNGSTCTVTDSTIRGIVGQGGSILTATGANSVLDATQVTSIVDEDATTTTMGVLATQGGVVNLGSATISVASTNVWSSGFGGVVASGINSVVNASGNLNVSTTGGGAYSSNDALRAQGGGKINIAGDVVLSTKGEASSAIRSDGANSSVNVGNVIATMSGDGSGSNGLHSTAGGQIVAKQVDITLNGGKQSYSYGLLADTSNKSTMTIDGGKITQIVGAGGSILNNQSNSAVRILNGGTINVNNFLEIVTNGMGARGVYVSEGGTLNLNNTSITTNGMTAAGMQIGKSRVIGTGPGVINSLGHLSIFTKTITSAAIYIEGENSALNADSATSSADIDSAGYAILYGGSSTASDQDTNAKVSLNNATLKTRHASKELIYVGGRNIGSSLNLTNSNATAGTGGWLINVTDNQVTDTMSPSGSVHLAPAEFTFNNSNTILTGSMTKNDNATLVTNLNNGSVWNIVGRNNDLSEISSMTELNLNDSTINAFAGGLANYTINAPINSVNGTINLSDGVVGDVLTINGNYVGNNGIVMLDTHLDDDFSPTDRLIINGDTSGTTKVKINAVSGSGAETIEGIEVITVNGNAGGTFELLGRTVKGAFDYFLVPGHALTRLNMNSWYLVSKVSPVIPDSEVVYRPEAGSYLANLAAANTLFSTQLYDRLGETQYIDALTGEHKVTSMWMRNVGGHNKFRDGSDQLKTTSNRYIIQLGGDVAQWSANGLDRWHLGVMAGYANSHSKTRSDITGYSSDGKVFGYSAGIYGTFYANQEDKSGLYVDSWALYNWFNNQVKGDDLTTEEYKSKGFTASLESGYSFKLGADELVSYWLQPKAQVIWMDVHANDHNEMNGTRVKDDTRNNISTVVGIKAFMNGHSTMDIGKQRSFEPFIEANWIHNSKDFTVNMDGIKNYQNGTKNMGEVKVGVNSQITPRVHVWGNVAQRFGSNEYSDTQATLGLKYNF